MDRSLVYDGALPQTTDVLNTNKFGLVGQAFLNQAVLGSSTVVAGLACAPTVPASLQVTVNTGSIYALDPTDAAAYADLGTDNNVIMKQGILHTAVNLTITPPATGGFSQVYLVQASLTDVDAGATVLSYYNSANPLAPFSGPANSGSSNFTTRLCNCNIALKAGVPATTGTQVTPSADSGFVGLYAITVANGAPTVTGGNIVQIATAPFFPTLPAVPTDVQNGIWVYAVDTGALNALIITPTPPVTALVAGMGFRVKVLVTNTAASTITINGAGGATFGPVTIHRGSGAAVAAADLTSGTVVDLVYDGTFFQMANYLGSGTNTNTTNSVGLPYIADSGAVNALVGTYSPAITSGQQVAGLTLAIKLANTITGACTINVNGLGLKNVTLGDITNPPFNVFVAGLVLIIEYDGTQYQIINTSAGMFYRQPTGNYNIFVNTSTGNDSTLDGTQASVSGSRGPFKTIQKGINVAWSYAPSPFTVTVNVAAGTYNENPTTPTWEASAVILLGAGSGSTFVASTSSSLSALTVSSPTSMTVQGFTFNGSALAGIFGQLGANIIVQNCAMNNTSPSGQPIWAIGATNILVGTNSFGGNGDKTLFSENGSSINFAPSAVITISGSISVTTGFAVASIGGYILANVPSPPSFVNPAFLSGPKYAASLNGVIYALTLGANFFPGTVAGSTASGGQYQP